MAGGSRIAINYNETPANTRMVSEGSTIIPTGRTNSTCSSFIGRVIGSSKRLSKEESMFSCYGMRLRKGRRSSRKFNCISSSDVHPSRAGLTCKKSRSAHDSVHTNENIDGLGNKKNKLNYRTSTMYRGLRHRLGVLFCERGFSANIDRSPSRSQQSPATSFCSGSWRLSRRIPRSNDVYSNDTMSHTNVVPQVSRNSHNRRNLGHSRTSSGSYEIISAASFSNDEISQSPVNGSSRIGFRGHMSTSQRSMTGLWFDSGMSPSTPRTLPNLASPVFSTSPSISRARLPFVIGMSHRARSLEVISSPLSYMSSPDMHFPNSDMRRVYASAMQSPHLGRAVSSPDYEGRHQARSSSETPAFRSFRQFPHQMSEEMHDCFSYGFSEQVLMWEANLILAGGFHSQDQYRDLRLNIDNMSYEDLLALEESIGTVCTGLKRDAISRCLESYTYTQKFSSTEEGSETKCSICQVDFEEGSELAVLKCGHNHHFVCIEEWLLLKNQCPICKASAS